MESIDNKNPKPIITQETLNDFIATVKGVKYSDQELFIKFPEFEGDVSLLQAAKDYEVTASSGTYKTVEELNSKFPEFEGLKKKELAEALSSPGEYKPLEDSGDGSQNQYLTKVDKPANFTESTGVSQNRQLLVDEMTLDAKKAKEVRDFKTGYDARMKEHDTKVNELTKASVKKENIEKQVKADIKAVQKGLGTVSKGIVNTVLEKQYDKEATELLNFFGYEKEEGKKKLDVSFNKQTESEMVGIIEGSQNKYSDLSPQEALKKYLFTDVYPNIKYALKNELPQSWFDAMTGGRPDFIKYEGNFDKSGDKAYRDDLVKAFVTLGIAAQYGQNPLEYSTDKFAWQNTLAGRMIDGVVGGLVDAGESLTGGTRISKYQALRVLKDDQDFASSLQKVYQGVNINPGKDVKERATPERFDTYLRGIQTTSEIFAPFMIGGGIVGGIEAAGAGLLTKSATGIRFLNGVNASLKSGNAITRLAIGTGYGMAKSGASYAASSPFMQDGSSLKNESEFVNGAIGQVGQDVGTWLIGSLLKVATKNKINIETINALKGMSGTVTKGAIRGAFGELPEEFAQSVYEIYKSTDSKDEFFKTFKQQFSGDNLVDFLTLTLAMGTAMGGSSIAGQQELSKELTTIVNEGYKNLSPEQQDKFDKVTGVDNVKKEVSKAESPHPPLAEQPQQEPTQEQQLEAQQAVNQEQQVTPEVVDPVSQANPVSQINQQNATGEVQQQPNIDALKDVESTAKALEGVKFNANFNLPIGQTALTVSEAYHQAKQDGSNPELVQAVEKLLGGGNQSEVQVDNSIAQSEAEQVDVNTQQSQVQETEQSNTAQSLSRNDLPESQSNTRTPATQKILDYIAEVEGVAPYNEDINSGTYVSWLQNISDLGYKVTQLLNAPRKAFDAITEYKAKRDAFIDKSNSGKESTPKTKAKPAKETKTNTQSGIKDGKKGKSVPDRVELDKKNNITVGKSEYNVSKTDEGLVVINTKTGKPIDNKSKNYQGIVNEYVLKNKESFEQGIEADPEEGMSPSEFNSKIASDSKNPAQVAIAWKEEVDNNTSKLSAKEEIIKEKLGSFPMSDFKRFGDTNQIKGASQIKLNYFSKDGTRIDVQAQSMSEDNGLQIEISDIIDFVLKYPNGPRSIKASNPLMVELETKFKELTGIDINEQIAKEVSFIANAEEEISDEVLDFIEKNNVNKDNLDSFKSYFEGFPFEESDFVLLKKSLGNEQEKRSSSQADRNGTQSKEGRSGKPGKAKERRVIQETFGDQSQSKEEIVKEINSIPLTHAKGLNMGSNQAEGSYISTESENRYAKDGGQLYTAEVSIKNPFVFSEEGGGINELRNQILRDRINEFNDSHFESMDKAMVEQQETISIDDLNNEGIKKLAGMVTEALEAEGFDSIYFQGNPFQEGELIVFKRSNVKLTPVNSKESDKDSGTTLAFKTFKKLFTFEKKTDTSVEQAFKIYEKVIEMIGKYSPDSKIMQGYNKRGTLGTFNTLTKTISLKSINDINTAFHELAHSLDQQFSVVTDLLSTASPREFSDRYDEAKSNNASRSELKKMQDEHDAAKALRTDLKKLYIEYYPGAKSSHSGKLQAIEGYACLLQNYVSDPTITRSKYPDLVANFIDKGGKYTFDKIEAFIKDATGLVESYQKLRPLDKMGARVSSDPIQARKDHREGIFTKADDVAEQMADAIHKIEVLGKKDGTQMTADDVAQKIRFSNNHAIIARNNIEGDKGFWMMGADGQYAKKYDFNYKTIIKKLSARKLEDDFAHWLVARRLHFEYVELKNNIEELDALNQIEQEELTREDKKEIKRLEKEIKELSDILAKESFSELEIEQAYREGKDMFTEEVDMFDKLAAADLEFLHHKEIQIVNNETFEKLSNVKGYASFKRETYNELLGDPDKDMPKIKTPGNTKIGSLVRRKGSDRIIINPLISAMANHAEVTRKALKQRAINQIGKNAKNHPELFQELELQVIVDKTTGSVSYPQENDRNIVMTMRNYKKVPILVDTEIKGILDENYDYNTVHLMFKIMNMAVTTFKIGTTAVYFPFAIANTLVDQATAGYNTKTGMIPFFSSAKEMHKTFTKGATERMNLKGKSAPGMAKEVFTALTNSDSIEKQLFDEYIFLADFSHTSYNFNKDAYREVSRKILGGSRTKAEKTLQVWQKILDIAGTPANMSEISTRSTEYIRARKAGDTQEIALEKAGRVSAPFHHMGKLGGKFGQQWVKASAYANAAMQVLSQTARSINTPLGRKRFLFAMSAMTAAQVIPLLAIISFDDDEAKEVLNSLTPEDLAKHIYLPRPFEEGSLIKLRVPETLTLVGTMINMAIMDMYMNAEYEKSDYFIGATEWIPDNIKLYDRTQFLLSNTPHLIKGEIEVTFNKKSFPTIKDIETPRDLKELSQYRYNEYTSAAALAIGRTEIAKKLDLSPKMVDHLIESKLGRAIKFLTGKPDAFDMGKVLKRELWFESSRQLLYYYDISKKIDQKNNELNSGKGGMDKGAKTLQMEEISNDINAMLDLYKQTDIVNKEPKKAENARKTIYSLISQLRKLDEQD